MTKLFLIPIVAILCGVVFIGGVLLAYELDVATSKAPDVWAEQRVN